MNHNLSRAVLLVALIAAGCSDSQTTTPADAEADSEAAISSTDSPPQSEQEGNQESDRDALILSETLREIDGLFPEPHTGDLDTMQELGVVRVLTVYSTGQYYIHRGEERGITKEIAILFERHLNRDNKSNVKQRVLIVPVARNELIPALLDGRGDIIMANLSITPERQELIDFSDPISKPVSEVLVTGPSAPQLSSIEDLAGQVVHVRESSSYKESLDRLNAQFAEKGKSPVEIEPVSEFLEDEDLLEMVNSGLLPWAVVDNYKVHPWQEVFHNLTPRSDIVLNEGGRIGWGMRPDSPLLTEEVNAFVKTHKQGTLVGNVLFNRYVTNFDWEHNAFSEDDFARFQLLLEYFKKYGEMYEVDYLLAAAQGYQESRLDQGARSAAGAVGIMQLLPSTATDHNIAIADIDQAENNIHAGIKYLSFLRNRYFDEPDIDLTEQTLLALAAYNIGPSRMINLRNKAESKGYNNDIWFDNVELVAATHVGREPVQYVSNIYKYYVAYRGALRDVTMRRKARAEAGIEDN
ncbi:MAG: transporter substrate-binding domain-containing protein [Pseudomonadota bacterium]